jgi:hypothetical protein
MDANQGIPNKLSLKTVHLIGERKISERRPAIACIGADWRKLAGNRLRDFA